MMHHRFYGLTRSLSLYLVLSFVLPVYSVAQQVKDSTVVLKSASLSYNKSKSYQKKWGKHYREEWKTPVLVQKLQLNTISGGLTPYEMGGGRQSRSLKLRDKNNREYVLRSIDKSFGGALPVIAKGTFIETFMNDQVTISHPYAAVTIPLMAEAAGILHTNPEIYFVAHQPALGKYNDSIADEMYILEQRPDENWETASNFGNATNIVSTEKMQEKLFKDNDNKIDQLLFVRSRLFDMFIGDWARHDDQWRWAEFKDKGITFKPIPRDRDQTYSLFDGTYLNLIKGVAGAKHLQSFDYSIKKLSLYNFPARNLDHHYSNQVTEAQWIAIAKDLQLRLTDAVIEASVKQMPPEVFPISGLTIINKLKARRETLVDIASRYYKQLAEETDITGTKENELFVINRTQDSSTVQVFKLKKDGSTSTPFYQRTFYTSETNEIRLYGIDGNDSFKITGAQSNIKFRFIGGLSKDTYAVPSNNKRNKVVIYDDAKNDFPRASTKLKISNDSALHQFTYDAIAYSKKNIHPVFSFNNPDRLHIGAGLLYQKHEWRKEFAQRHNLDLKYSISQKAFSITYDAIFKELFGKTDLLFTALYDQERWKNYYGLGNNSVLQTKDRDFNRMRSSEVWASTTLQRTFQKKHTVFLSPYFEQMKILEDSDRYIGKTVLPEGLYETRQFTGLEAGYQFIQMNDPYIPSKGFGLSITGKYQYDLKNKVDFVRYTAETNIIIPLISKFSVALKAGGASLTGTPQFFQYNAIGGTNTLRGYQRDRFHGEHTFYNQNELRWINNIRSYLMNGKFGVFAFVDNGRVWMKGENSNKWHMGYGGGVFLSPFNKFTVSVSYGLSEEDSNIHLNFIKAF